MGATEIIAENFPKLVTNINWWIQEFQQITDKENTKKHIKVPHNKSNYESQR